MKPAMLKLERSCGCSGWVMSRVRAPRRTALSSVSPLDEYSCNRNERIKERRYC